MKVAFHPHIVGYGHRVRCNLIVREIRRLEPKTRIVFLDRTDDPLYDEDWTPYKRVHGGVRRTISMFTSSCLVEDCAMIEDFRRRWYSVRGKIVTILHPDIGAEFLPRKPHLEFTDLIVIPYPKGFFPFPDVLEDFKEKVEWFGPVLNLPVETFRRKETDKPKINVLLSRGRERVVPFIKELAEDLDFEIIQIKFKSDQEYFSALSETTIAITQGAHAVFECSHLGVPQFCLPINEEQLVVAKRYEEAGGLKYLPFEEASRENIRRVLGEMVSGEGLWDEMVRKAQKFASPPGTKDIAKSIIDITRRTK